MLEFMHSSFRGLMPAICCGPEFFPCVFCGHAERRCTESHVSWESVRSLMRVGSIAAVAHLMADGAALGQHGHAVELSQRRPFAASVSQNRPSAAISVHKPDACSLLRELDHGPAALPRGSEVVLFNQHGPPAEMAQRADIANMDNICITHVRGNPSNRRDLAQKINIPTCVIASTPHAHARADESYCRRHTNLVCCALSTIR